MKKIINIDNNNNLTGKYPAFLGDDLGYADTINVTYPEIHEMHLKQRSFFWTENEISLSQDRIDLEEMDKEQRDVMMLNLFAQWLIDSLAAKSVLSTFEPFISNNEVYSLLNTQSYFEGIHAATYSEIVKNCFKYSNEALEQAKNDVMVTYRSKVISKVFQETKEIGLRYSLGEEFEDKFLKKQIIKNLAALYGLEAISFMASFACTFALTQTGKCQGIDKSVGLIVRDEVEHAEGDRLLFNVVMKKESGYREAYEECKHEVQEIFDEIVKQEMKWSEYIFSEGRKVLGLNEENLKQYVLHNAKPCYDYLGLDWGSKEVVEENPLPYMEQYTNMNLVQTAPQELDVNNYLVGQVDNDVADVDFEF